MTGTTDRIRATLLALVVVVSVAVAPIAFGGTATAQANNLRIESTQPVAGDGTVTVTMSVSAGANASFMIADSAGTTSSVRTVTDDGDGDALGGTAGKVKVTLDLSTLFSSTPASGGGMVYGNEGDTASTGAPKSRELSIDSSSPTVSVGGSTTLSAAAGESIDIPYSLADKPSSSSVSGTMQIVTADGTVVYQFSDSVQTGSSRTAQTTLPADLAAGTYDIRLTATDAVGHTENATWTDGLEVTSSSNAIATKAAVVSAEPIKGDGTVTVSAKLKSTTGNNITFAVQDGANALSESKTVRDGGPNDDSSMAGTVETTLDLDALYGSTDVTSDSQALLLASGGQTVTTNADTSVQFAIDAEPPTVIMLGAGSNTNPKPIYTRSGVVSSSGDETGNATASISWNATDVPQKYKNYTITVSRHGDEVTTVDSSAKDPPISANSHTVTVPETWAEGRYNLSITIHDEVGYSANDSYTGGLVVDETDPAVTDTYLQSSASADEGGQMIVLDFVEGPINADTVDAQDFNITVDSRTLPENATGVSATNLNVTMDGDVTMIPRLRGNENLTDQTRTDWVFQSPSVHLNSSEFIADRAGNQLQGPRTWYNVTGGSGAPQDPDEILVSPTPVTGSAVTNVTVGVNFTRTVQGENGPMYYPDPPQQGTIHLRFEGPNGAQFTKSMATNTNAGLTEATFDLTGHGLDDGKVTIMAKVIDEDGNTNPSGYDAPTIVDVTFPPSVASMNVSNAPIDAAEANASQTVTVEFTEQMNTDVAPTVEVTGLPNGSVPVTQSTYQNATWTGTVDLPQGVDTTATLEVSNATAPNGASLPETATSSFQIDSERPADPVNITFADSTINASEMDSVGVNVTFDGSVDATTLTLKFEDGNQTATRTVNVSASASGSTYATTSSQTTVSATVNLTNSGLNGSVTASAQVTDALGNANPSGYTATSTAVEFQADSSGSGGSGDGSGGSGNDGSGGDSGGNDTVNLTAPSDVAVANAPLNASEMDGVPVTVTFPAVPDNGSVEVTFADEDSTREEVIPANTTATTTSATIAITPKNFSDGPLDVSARFVDSGGNESSAASTSVIVDTAGPTFSDRTPAAGSTAGLGLDTISVDVTDAGVGVNSSALLVSIEDGDSDSTWDVEHATTNSSQVAYANGTLTYTPTSSFEGGNVTVHVTAADSMGHQTETQWNFTSTSIEQLSIDAVEHDFVGVVQEPDASVTVSATATGTTGSPIQATSGGTFELALTRNGSKVAGTQTVTADASGGTIDFDLTSAITGTPDAGPVNVTVSTASGDAVATTAVNLTHKVVAFDQKWELMGTPMPVRTLHTSGVANFYSYSPGSGYESGVDPTQAGIGYYAERNENATTARVGYTFETASRTTFGNQTLEPGWNLVGASFDVDAKNGVAVEKDLAPTQFDDPGVVVYAEQQGDLHLVTSGSTTVGEFDGYFVYVSNETTRVFAVESYQPADDQQSTA